MPFLFLIPLSSLCYEQSADFGDSCSGSGSTTKDDLPGSYDVEPPINALLAKERHELELRTGFGDTSFGGAGREDTRGAYDVCTPDAEYDEKSSGD